MLKPSEKILKKNHINLLDYNLLKILGKGSFGKVYLISHKKTKTKYAMKEIEKKNLSSKDSIRIKREMQIVSSLSHSNIIKTEDIVETSIRYLIIMEFCPKGELFSYIVKKRKLSFKETSIFFYQITNALHYLHSRNIIHRDIKPENILLSSNNTIKLIDFGLSNFSVKNKQLITPCGSPCYASPEMLKGVPYNGEPSDVWSLGVVLYAMVCGFLPFMDEDKEILYNKIKECKYTIPNWVHPVVEKIIRKLLVVNPGERMKIKDIKEEQFYLKGRWNYFVIMGRGQMGKWLSVNKEKEIERERNLRNIHTPIYSFEKNKGNKCYLKMQQFNQTIQVGDVNGRRDIREYIYVRKKRFYTAMHSKDKTMRNCRNNITMNEFCIRNDINNSINNFNKNLILLPMINKAKTIERKEKDDKNKVMEFRISSNSSNKAHTITKTKFFLEGKIPLNLKMANEKMRDKNVNINSYCYKDKKPAMIMRNSKISKFNVCKDGIKVPTEKKINCNILRKFLQNFSRNNRNSKKYTFLNHLNQTDNRCFYHKPIQSKKDDNIHYKILNLTMNGEFHLRSLFN